ncbi:MAG: Thermostable monoacylglycerol lipase [bacterium ADurb.Bin236]|nr:MAG: Thermostable monoacylglycerol lipase [bacterium ADurb.Bin236]HPN95448.1 alpha/beta fold hydrolase [bacterium]
MGILPHKCPPLATEPFLIRRGRVGCLLIHGFTSSPAEMIFLADYLAERDITVSGIQLAGHGTTADEMALTGWRDWAESAERGFAELREICDEVFVAGLSMGGALTLYLASRHELPSAICMAAASEIHDWKLFLLPLFKRFIRFFPKIGDDFIDKEQAKYIVDYDYIPLNCLESLIEFSAVVRECLPKVTCPLLAVQGRKDKLVRPETAQHIYDSVSSIDKQILWLDNSGHCAPVDAQRDIVFEKTHEWIRSHSRLIS